ncbi:MAG: hypothetical protein IAF38_01285 [Bacteroidia bacterium]|nr:hypothetical protein [Bacteroidia bacterium]
MKNKELYTFVTTYDGGTFIMQLRANNLSDAVDTYLFKKLKPLSKVMGFSYNKKQIKEDLEIGTPFVKIDKTKNVFCFGCTLGKKFALFNIIKTSLN